MSLRKPIDRITVVDYLEGEKESPIRHEYVDGHVFAMAGASDRHNLIAGTVYARLIYRNVEFDEDPQTGSPHQEQ